MATKLLLIEDVENLGRSGDIVSVKPGFARNFLLPSGAAIVATAHAIRKQAKLKEEREKQAEIDKKESEDIAAKLAGITLMQVVKVDPKGNPYGSVSAADVSDLLLEQHKLEVEKRMVMLKHPIKTLGVHNISIKLKEGVSTSIVLKVRPENYVEEAPAPAEESA